MSKGIEHNIILVTVTRVAVGDKLLCVKSDTRDTGPDISGMWFEDGSIKEDDPTESFKMRDLTRSESVWTFEAEGMWECTRPGYVVSLRPVGESGDFGYSPLHGGFDPQYTCAMDHEMQQGGEMFDIFADSIEMLLHEGIKRIDDCKDSPRGWPGVKLNQITFMALYKWWWERSIDWETSIDEGQGEWELVGIIDTDKLPLTVVTGAEVVKGK